MCFYIQNNFPKKNNTTGALLKTLKSNICNKPPKINMIKDESFVCQEKLNLLLLIPLLFNKNFQSFFCLILLWVSFKVGKPFKQILAVILFMPWWKQQIFRIDPYKSCLDFIKYLTKKVREKVLTRAGMELVYFLMNKGWTSR